jgi:hypothetical protein
MELKSAAMAHQQALCLLFAQAGPKAGRAQPDAPVFCECRIAALGRTCQPPRRTHTVELYTMKWLHVSAFVRSRIM